MRWRGAAALGALWTAAACVAVAIGLVAVHLVAGQVGSTVATPLSDGNVQQALASLPPSNGAGARPTRPPTTSSPVAQGPLRTVRTAGGVVGARCIGGSPALVYAAPSDAWRTDRSTDELVRFVSTRARIDVSLSCSDEELRYRVRTTPLGAGPSPTPHESTHSPEPGDSPDAQESDSPTSPAR